MLKNTTGIIIRTLLNKKKNTKKKKHKELMIKMFGKKRYYLAYWFGQWVLFIGNNRDYSSFDPNPYQKFYKNEAAALRYASKLQEHYQYIKITKVFTSKGQHIGYMLNGSVKQELPKNVVPMQKLKGRA